MFLLEKDNSLLLFLINVDLYYLINDTIFIIIILKLIIHFKINT